MPEGIIKDVQRERFEDPTQYECLKSSYILTRKLVEEGKLGLAMVIGRA
jgi:hypothetical protein